MKKGDSEYQQRVKLITSVADELKRRGIKFDYIQSPVKYLLVRAPAKKRGYNTLVLNNDQTMPVMKNLFYDRRVGGGDEELEVYLLQPMPGFRPEKRLFADWELKRALRNLDSESSESSRKGE